MLKFSKYFWGSVFAVCSMMFSTSLTAYAQNLDECTFTESEKQAALSCIEEAADSFDSTVTYAVDGYSEQSFSMAGTDVEQGCIVRTVRNDMAAQYYKSGDFLSAVYGEPMYLVPVSNGDIDGTILLKKDEAGKMEFYGQHQSTGLGSANVTFDLSAVGPADKKLDTKICCIQAILPAKIAIVYCNFSIFSYSKPCLREMEYR